MPPNMSVCNPKRTPGFCGARPDIIALVRQWVMANNPVTYTQCRAVLAKGVTELIRPEPPITTPTLIMTAANDLGTRHREKIVRATILDDLFGATRHQVSAPLRVATGSGEFNGTEAKKGAGASQP